jgi:hypothetical protein
MVLLFVVMAGVFSAFSAIFRGIFLAGAGTLLGVLYFSVGKHLPLVCCCRSCAAFSGAA